MGSPVYVWGQCFCCGDPWLTRSMSVFFSQRAERQSAPDERCARWTCSGQSYLSVSLRFLVIFSACSVCFSKVSQWAWAGRRLRAALHLRREESGWRYATRPPWKPLMHERTSPSLCRSFSHSLALTRFTFGCEHWTLFVKYLVKKKIFHTFAVKNAMCNFLWSPR